VESRFLLDVVIRKGSAVLELLSCEDQSLLLRGDSFLVLDLGLDIRNGVIGLNVQGDRLSREGLDENLHGSSSESENQVEGRFLLNVVVREGSAILELLSSEDQTLLLWWDAFLVLDLRLDVLDGVIWLDIQGDRLSGKGLDKDLHGTTSKTKDKMEGRFLLDIVVRKGSPILELLSSEDQTLLLWWDAFLVLDLRFHVLDGVVGFDVQSDRLSGEGLDEDLHGTTSKAKDKMESRLLLNVVVREGSAILKLLSSEDQTLLLWWNSFLVLDLRLDVLDGVVWLDVQSDRLSRKGLDKDLHGTTSKSEDQVKGRFLLDVVIRKGSSILKLFSSEDQSLLLWGDSLLVLNLGLDVGDCVVGFDIKGNGFARKGLHENLHRHGCDCFSRD